MTVHRALDMIWSLLLKLTHVVTIPTSTYQRIVATDALVRQERFWSSKTVRWADVTEIEVRALLGVLNETVTIIELTATSGAKLALDGEAIGFTRLVQVTGKFLGSPDFDPKAMIEPLDEIHWHRSIRCGKGSRPI